MIGLGTYLATSEGKVTCAVRGFAISRNVLVYLILISSAIAQGTQGLPGIKGETLTGRNIEFPDAAVGKITVLVFGFTKASGKAAEAWAKKISADFGTRNGLEVYQLPVLEDVPRLFRSVVLSGIKKGVPQDTRDHFVPLLRGETELKKTVNYADPDDAYLVVLNKGGKIALQMHGTPDEMNYANLRQQLDSLLK